MYPKLNEEDQKVVNRWLARVLAFYVILASALAFGFAYNAGDGRTEQADKSNATGGAHQPVIPVRMRGE